VRAGAGAGEVKVKVKVKVKVGVGVGVDVVIHVTPLTMFSSLSPKGGAMFIERRTQTAL